MSVHETRKNAPALRSVPHSAFGLMGHGSQNGGIFPCFVDRHGVTNKALYGHHVAVGTVMVVNLLLATATSVILSVLSKVLERIVHDQVYSYLNEYNRTNYSTDTCLIH